MYKLTEEEQNDLELLKGIEYKLYKQYETLIELDMKNKSREKEDITRDIMGTLIKEIPFISKYLLPSKANNIYNYLEEQEKPIDLDSVNYYCGSIESLINKRIMVYLQPFVFQSEEYKNKLFNKLENKDQKEEYFKIAVKTNSTIKNDITKILINNIEEVLEDFPQNIKKELIRTKYNIIFINNSIENLYLQEGFNYIDFPYIEGKLKLELEIPNPASSFVYDDLLNYKCSNQLLYTLIKINNYYSDLDLDNPQKLKEIIIYLATIKTAMSGTKISTIKENIELMQLLNSSKNKNITQLALLILKDYEKTKNKHRVISLRINTK